VIRNSAVARTVMGTHDIEMPRRRWVWRWARCMPLVALMMAASLSVRKEKTPALVAESRVSYKTLK
jgi:hypothetical protein